MIALRRAQLFYPDASFYLAGDAVTWDFSLTAFRRYGAHRKDNGYEPPAIAPRIDWLQAHAYDHGIRQVQDGWVTDSHVLVQALVST